MTPSAAGLALVWRLGLATSLIVLAFSMTGPVLAVLLQQAGYGTAVIGAFAMLPFLLIGALIPVVPRVLARFGVLPTYRWGAALELVSAIGYALGDGLWVWSLCSVVSGIGAAALWNATEALLAQQAPPAMRGRVMGLYQTALGAALAIGPFVPAMLGGDAKTTLWLAAVMVAGCQALSLAARPLDSGGATPHHEAGTWRALRDVPWLAAIAFTGGVFEAGLGAIGSAHASATGRSLAAAATVAGAVGIGSFLCQYPAGLAADHFRMRNVFTGAAFALLLASIAFGFVGQVPWLLWACGLVWGGVGGALYTLTMVQVAHAFAGRATAGGAAAMITGYTLGGSIGPLASGAVLQWAGLIALAGTLSALALFALAAARRAAPVDV
ncbi:MFS transporter [Caenimonas sedimenti]|uniref:MFS transporter n=1 Tax=Caenimonas sedimenti TaxID=2596921 RepID=A0A562ZQB8_9BURK|nr:MFS transporter [Caenimonas sedimenti]TWO70485.1 MFS transporter [Caenimonas sedimenti]